MATASTIATALRLAAFAGASIGAACAAPSALAPAAPAPPPLELAPALRSPAETPGVEVRQWAVTAPPDRIDAALAAFRGGGERPDRSIEGLRFIVGEATALPDLLVALGGTPSDLRAWHGQATSWRDLRGTALLRPEILLLEGRPVPIPPGRLALQMRGWSIPMEDGAACEVQVAVRWRPESRPSFIEPPPLDRAGRWLPSTTFAATLGRDEVLVIAAPPPRHDAALPGPPVDLPRTIGQRLLDEGGSFETILLVWPHLPAWLFPDAEAP